MHRSTTIVSACVKTVYSLLTVCGVAVASFEKLDNQTANSANKPPRFTIFPPNSTTVLGRLYTRRFFVTTVAMYGLSTLSTGLTIKPIRLI